MNLVSLFFVRADDPNGENLDLLVEALNRDDAEALWQDHFELETGCKPLWIGVVPVTGQAGIIDWKRIN